MTPRTRPTRDDGLHAAIDILALHDELLVAHLSHATNVGAVYRRPPYRSYPHLTEALLTQLPGHTWRAATEHLLCEPHAAGGRQAMCVDAAYAWAHHRTVLAERVGRVVAALALLGGLALGWTPIFVRAALAAPSVTTIGITQSGIPLVVYALGDGPRRVFVLAGQHGGPEANTVELAGGLLEYFADTPSALPDGIELDVLPIANPDGLAVGSRQFLSGVDPNRNWGGSDWQSDAFDSNAVFRAGLGGPEPFSEPETRALAEWVLASRPAFIVNYHSAGGFMFGSHTGTAGDFARVYAQTSGYSWPAPGGQSPLPYSTSGSMNTWLREVGIPSILVELSTPRVTEIERNLAGLSAVLRALVDAPRAARQPASGAVRWASES